MTKYPKVVVYAATRNFYKYLPMAIGSLLEYNPDANVLVIAEDEYIDIIQDERILILKYDKIAKYLDEKGPNFNSHWTYMSLTRLFLSKIILHLSRVLWLDVDTLVTDNIDELFNIDMTNKAIASVMEPRSNIINNNILKPYVNSGVTLFNLDLIRELKLDDKMIELINTKKYNFPDQDVINEVCNFRIKYLDPKYNVSPSTYLYVKPCIVHFTYKKLWDNPDIKFWQKYYRERL